MKNLSSILILLAVFNDCNASRPHSFLVPNDAVRNQVKEQSRIIEATSDNVWQKTSALFQSVDKVEKAVIHAAVGAVRDEVDVLFHDSDHCEKHSESHKVIATKMVSPKQDNNEQKYPYGWGLD